MSLTDLQIVAQKDDVLVSVESPPPISLTKVTTPDLLVIAAGNVGPTGPPGATGPEGPIGPEGPQGKWVSLTQAEYNALDPPDADTLYVIVE
jgi:hypothetical protein